MAARFMRPIPRPSLRAPSLAALLTLCSTLLLGACAGTPIPGVGDGGGRPVLVVAYTPNDEVRRGFETRMETDLQAADIRAIPSVGMIRDFHLITHDAVLDAAAARDAPVVLMVRRIITELPGDGTETPAGVTRHRSLREYFLNVDRDRLPDLPPPGRQVIEVAAYRSSGNGAELAWSGYSWVDYDGDLGAAIRQTADLVAANMIAASNRLREAR